MVKTEPTLMLKKPWSWAYDEAIGWYARGPRSHTVCVDERGDVAALFHGTEHFDPPAIVVLPVLLASQGMAERAADLPEPRPRRPFDDSHAERARAGLDYYEESDRDYLENNNDLAVYLLDAYMRSCGMVES
jgi:hypothetical protein